MSTSQKSTQELTNNIIAQLEATLNQTIPLAPKSFLRVIARTFAAVFVLLYKYIGFGALQMFVGTASAEETLVNGKPLTPLYEWGKLVGIGLPASATQTELELQVTVETQLGTLPAGSQLVYQPTGVTYITLSAVLLNLPTVTVIARAVSDQTGGNGAGEIGNVNNGLTLSFANPLPNVARDVLVTGTVTTGADGEDVEVYRQRILDRFRQRPQGGALADYRIWGEEPAGVLNVYPYRSGVCPGQVDLYVESATETDGIPTTDQLDSVLESVELDASGLATRRPVGALVNALPIDRISFDVTVYGLVVDDIATVKTRITTALNEYAAEREPYIVGLDFPPRFDRITNSAVSGVVDDIVSSAGGTFTGVLLELNLLAVVTYSLGAGEKAKFNSVVFS